MTTKDIEEIVDCTCKNCHPGLCKCKCHSFNQSKYDVDLEERVRHEFSTVIPKAGLLKGKETLCGTVRFKHLLTFIEKERTSSYKQGVREGIEKARNAIFMKRSCRSHEPDNCALCEGRQEALNAPKNN